MKTIGLIGGMSWESTSEYYRVMNQQVNKRLGDLNSCRCIIFSVNFEDIQRADWDGILELTIDAARRLEGAGADMLLMCANSMHKIADDVQKSVNIPLVHIADATACEIRKAGLKKVGLMGTKTTMEQSFYKGRLKDVYDIDVVIPDSDDRIRMNDIIFKELAHGIMKQTTKENMIEIGNDLIRKGAEGIVLGCTEIPLIIGQDDFNVTVFNTTFIHASAAVELSLK